VSVQNFIPEVWASDIGENWREAVVLAGTFTDVSSMTRMGDRIHITSFGGPTITDYAGAGRVLTTESLIDAGQVLDLDNEKAFSFYIDDVDAAQAAGSFGQVTMDAGAELAEDFETAAATELLAEGAASSYGAVADGDAAYALVLELRRTLSQAKAPLGGRTLAVDPLFAEILLGADSKLSQADTSGSPQGLREATIGRLLGFDVVETSLLGDGSHATCVAYHRQSVAFASQLDKTESLRAPDRFADIVRGLHVYGVKVIRNPGVIYWQAS
jgi:hypothetical protein